MCLEILKEEYITIIWFANVYLQVSWLISKLSMTASPKEALHYIAKAHVKMSSRIKEFGEWARHGNMS